MSSWLNLLSGAIFGLGCGVAGVSSCRLRFQNDAKLLSPEKRIFLESKIREIANKLQIDKPVELIEVEGLIVNMQAQGIARLSGRIGIAIDPGFIDRRSEAELEFLIAHELAHIKTNDVLWAATYAAAIGMSWTAGVINLVPASATYFSSKLVTCVMGVASPTAAVGLTASLIALSWFSRVREEQQFPPVVFHV